MGRDSYQTLRREIGRLIGHQVGTRCLAFSADGRRLASGSDDQACLVWDLKAMARVAAGPPPSLSAQELEELWTELALPDSPRAFKALGRLVACSSPAATFLGKKLQPVPAIAAARIAQLIRDLDDEEFAVREKATEELEEFGDSVKPALRAALKTNASPELQARIKQLLAKEPRLTLPPDHLRESRALEVLEYVGTVEAKRVLATLAKGAPEAKLTQDAKGALERWSKKITGP